MTRRRFRPLALMLPLALASIACRDGSAPDEPVPASLEIVSGHGQSMLRGDDAPEPLRVRVLDAGGRPVDGATVGWSITHGEATLSSAETTTEPNGEAEVQVTLIATVGEIRVRAVAGSAAAASSAPADTLSLYARNPCLTGSQKLYAPGTVRQGELRPIDCEQSDGQIYDFYRFFLETHQAVDIRMTAQTFAPGVFLVPTIENTPRGGRMDAEGLTREAVFKVIVPADDYTLALTSSPAGSTGSYEFMVSPASTSADDCEFVLIVRGISTNQRLDASDCSVDGAAPSGTSFGDSFWLVLYPGERLSVVQSSSSFAPRLRLNQRSGQLITESVADASGVATLEFTVETLAYYEIVASSVAPDQSGEYSLSVTRPASASSAVSPSHARDPWLGAGARESIAVSPLTRAPR